MMAPGQPVGRSPGSTSPSCLSHLPSAPRAQRAAGPRCQAPTQPEEPTNCQLSAAQPTCGPQALGCASVCGARCSGAPLWCSIACLLGRRIRAARHATRTPPTTQAYLGPAQAQAKAARSPLLALTVAMAQSPRGTQVKDTHWPLCSGNAGKGLLARLATSTPGPGGQASPTPTPPTSHTGSNVHVGTPNCKSTPTRCNSQTRTPSDRARLQPHLSLPLRPRP
jgi:hypothetical protein